jgi:hypothetical protein
MAEWNIAWIIIFDFKEYPAGKNIGKFIQRRALIDQLKLELES